MDVGPEPNDPYTLANTSPTYVGATWCESPKEWRIQYFNYYVYATRYPIRLCSYSVLTEHPLVTMAYSVRWVTNTTGKALLSNGKRIQRATGGIDRSVYPSGENQMTIDIHRALYIINIACVIIMNGINSTPSTCMSSTHRSV